MLWLRVHGCGNGVVPVAVEQPGPRLLFLDRGWKSFAHAQNLWDGHILRFKMMADNLGLTVGHTLTVSPRSSASRVGIVETEEPTLPHILGSA
ncbi:hypothetical protein D1007_26877 [Hordeum vulgare]|nr:hypothetical protein D1007_26877 [Hordeum vulgare]